MIKHFRLATALTLVCALSLVLFVSGCSRDDGDAGSNTTSTSTSTTGQDLDLAQGVGSVAGVVVDSNGNPLAGVTVGILGTLTTTTNAAGQYAFADVPVADVRGADQDYYSEDMTAVLVTVVAPTGYLGATVAAYPYAQFDGSNDYTGDDAGSDVVSEGNNKVVTFVDGFVAQAVTAVLPELAAEVSGWLRDCDTGEALANLQVNLDFVATECAGNPCSDDIFYQTTPYVAFTNSDGFFTVSGVPVDSALDVLVGNYETDDFASETPTIVADVSTFDVVNNLGNISICEITDAGDEVDPFVVAASGVFAEGADRALLTKGIDGVNQPIVLIFNEPLDATVAANSVLVRDLTTGAYVDVASAVVDGNILTLTLVEALAQDIEFNVYLLRADFTDGTNFLDENAALDYDLITAAPAVVANQYVQVNLATFREANTNAEAPVLAQVGDNCPTAEEQLNAPEAEDRLQALYDADPFSGIGDIDVTTTELTFTATNASGYGIDYTDSDDGLIELTAGVPSVDLGVIGGTPVIALSQTGTNGPTQSGDFEASASGDLVTMDLTGFAIGDEVCITPMDDFGFEGTEVCIIIADIVEPTTVLQNGYGFGNTVTTGGVSGDDAYGDGAELSGESTLLVTEGGTPIFPVTPRLLADQAAAPSITEPAEIRGLYDANGINDPDVDVVGDEFQFEADIYDATSFIAWDDFSRVVGVAFSENISVTDGAAIVAGYDGTVGMIAEPTSLNDVLQQDDGDTFGHDADRDLVTLVVENVITFANIDDDAVIDFTDAVADEAGNVASTCANARVVIDDRMPPFVTLSYLDDDGLTIVFNEAIAPTDSDFVVLTSPDDAMDFAVISLADTTLSVDGLTLNIPFENLAAPLAGDFSRATLFSEDYAYAEAAYNAVGGAGALNHAILNTDVIEDLEGNAWEDFTGVVATPEFAAVDILGALTLTTNSPDFVAGTDDTFSLVYSFNQPLDMEVTFGLAAGVTTLTGAQVDAQFVFLEDTVGVNAFAATVAGNGATLSASGLVLTVVFDLTAGELELGDRVTPQFPYFYSEFAGGDINDPLTRIAPGPEFVTE
ncbi:hypothetical protein [uncultured Desulfuromonas sp.]|uniref:hypothetical protein n=1 Tax=uncultured Desulfuromonas sp. TaxID=181013 RepID=UPI002624F60E|nr:hypothetical protein [uncultured Desulfuromonas sp.]